MCRLNAMNNELDSHWSALSFVSLQYDDCKNNDEEILS